MKPDSSTSHALAAVWPIHPAFNVCLVRTALWFVGLLDLALDDDLVRAAMRLTDDVKARDRC